MENSDLDLVLTVSESDEPSATAASPKATLEEPPLRSSFINNQSARKLFNTLESLLMLIYKYTIGSCVPCSENSSESKRLFKPMDIQLPPNDDENWKEQKKKVNEHFENHLQKWLGRQKPRFPWKALFHLLLVALVTIQVICNYKAIRRLVI